MFPTYGIKLSCGKCGRVMLVEEAHNGVIHTMSRAITCWDCLTPEEIEKANAMYKFEEKHTAPGVQT